MTAVARKSANDQVPTQPQTERAPARTAEIGVVMDLLNRPDLPMERAEALLSRLDMIRERDESAAYNDAMRQVKAALPVVNRTTANSHTKKNYADLADISEACDGIIAQNGFSTEFWSFNSEKPDHLGIGCTVSHAGGHKREYRADVPLDGAGAKGNANKPAIHAWKSTMTYGRRALKEAIFDIATRDDDGNGAIPATTTISDEQVVRLQTLIENAGANKQKFLQHMKVDALEAMPIDRFDYAIAALNQKKEAAQ